MPSAPWWNDVACPSLLLHDFSYRVCLFCACFVKCAPAVTRATTSDDEMNKPGESRGSPHTLNSAMEKVMPE